MAKTPNSDQNAPQSPGGDENATQPNAARSNARRTDAAGSNTPQPTEQLPMESAPVSATDSASGGATGLASETPVRPSVFRRHPLATGITAGVIAVVVVSGLTAWGVGAAVTASLTSSTSSEMPMGTPTTAPTTAPAAGGAAAAGRVAFRATIQSMDGGSWTILTKKGKTVTVAIDSSTQFGTRKATATSGSFAVGDSIVVVAMQATGGTPTATRIAMLPAGAGAGAGAGVSTDAGA